VVGTPGLWPRQVLGRERDPTNGLATQNRMRDGVKM
jgi:hypothetical protein